VTDYRRSAVINTTGVVGAASRACATSATIPVTNAKIADPGGLATCTNVHQLRTRTAGLLDRSAGRKGAKSESPLSSTRNDNRTAPMTHLGAGGDY